MFLEFHEFETKYLAGVYKQHRTTIYVEYMLNYIVQADDYHMLNLSVESFNFERNSWEQLPEMSQARRLHTAVVV